MSQEEKNSVNPGLNDASIGLSGTISAEDDDAKEVGADKSRLAVDSASEIPDWEKIGWKRVSELSETNTDKKFQYDEILKELYCSDLWLYSGVVFCSLFTTWFIVLCGGSFGWIVVLCAFIATYLKNSVTRFYRNARSDIARENARIKLEEENEKVEWLNEFLRRFWLIYEPVLSATIVQVADNVLSASTPSFLDSLRLSTFTLGTKPPIIESIKSHPTSADDEVIMEWGISFAPNELADMTKAQLAKKINPKVILTVRVGRGFVGAGMPVLLEDLTFTGILRVKLKLIQNFPHVETVDLSFIDDPVLNFGLKPIGGETLGFDINKIVPGLAKFISDQIHATLRPMMYHPNVFTLVTDYLLNGYPVESCIGVLKLTFKDAKSLRNAETFGTSDPYCKVILQSHDATVTGKELTRTKVIRNSLNPVWNETKYLLLNDLKDTLKFQIMDSNGSFSTDTALGSNTFPLESLVEKSDQSNSTISVIHDGKQKGDLNIDACWYPVVKAKDDQPVPESNIGVLKFNIHAAKDLDTRFSLVGVYNPYAELIFNGKPVFRTRTYRRTNNPTWEEFFEIFITDRKEAKLSLNIRDERDFAEDPIVGFWSLTLDELLKRLNGKIDWFDVTNARSGNIRLSCQWKPVILDNIPESSGYAEPLGIAKLHIKKATDLKNVEQLKGKSDPYVRITLDTTYRGRTDVRNDNLNPIWDEYIYVPIHSSKEKFYLQCFDHQNYGKDRTLGITELEVRDLIKESDDGNVSPAELIDKAAPLNTKGSLFYSASFHPVLHTDEKLIKGGENNNLLEYKSGILVVNINKANFKKNNAYVEVLVGNDLFPSYITRASETSETSEPYWSEVAEIFIEELDFSKITFNIKHSSKSIGKVVSNVKELLEKCLKDDKDILLPIGGMDNCSLNIRLNYIPVKYDVELNESNSNSNMEHLEQEHLEHSNKKEQPTGAITNATTRAINDLGGSLSKIGTGFGLLKKKGKDEKKMSKEGEDIPVEEPKIEEVFPKKEHKLEEIKNEKPNTEGVIPKEETKPINEVNANQGPKPQENPDGTITNHVKAPQEEKQKQVEEANHVKVPQEENQKQVEETNGIKPYNIDSNQEEESQSSKLLTTRHIEFEKNQDEGPRSSEENRINNNKSNRNSTYGIVGEPGDLTISVIEAKNLMAASGGGTTSDPYVKVKMNGNKEVLKTHVIKKSTSPRWDEQVTLKGLTESPVSFLFYIQDRNLLSKNVNLGEHELNLWDYIKPGDYVKDIWVPLSKGSDSQLHIKLNFTPSAKRSSSSDEHRVNGSNGGSKGILGRLSGDSDREVNVHGNGKSITSKFTIRKKKN